MILLAGDQQRRDALRRRLHGRRADGDDGPPGPVAARVQRGLRAGLVAGQRGTAPVQPRLRGLQRRQQPAQRRQPLGAQRVAVMPQAQRAELAAARQLRAPGLGIRRQRLHAQHGVAGLRPGGGPALAGVALLAQRGGGQEQDTAVGAVQAHGPGR
ncbi:MAG: hypothetical protein ACK44A_05980 [Roseateles sp.]